MSQRLPGSVPSRSVKYLQLLITNVRWSTAREELPSKKKLLPFVTKDLRREVSQISKCVLGRFLRISADVPSRDF